MANLTARGALRLPRSSDWPPYLFLALGVLALMVAAYTPRPTVVVDLGGDRDGAFVQGFHGRELDASAALRSYEWPAGEPTLTLPAGLQGEMIAILHVAPDQPFNILRQAAVAVNDIRVTMPRRTPDTIVVRITPDLAQAPTLTFSLVSPLTGGTPPPEDIVGRVELAPARTYRWTAAESSLAFPHLGRGNWIANLRVITQHPDGLPLGATLTAGSLAPVALPDAGESRRVRLLVPATALSDGSLDLLIHSKVYTDPRPLGVLMSSVKVAPAAGTSLGTMLPPLSALVLALVGVLGGMATLHVLLGGRIGLHGRGPTAGLWALMGMVLAAMLGAWMLATYRFPSSFMLLRVASLAVGSLVLALALLPLTRWLFRVLGAPLEQDEDTHALLDRPAVTNLLSGRQFQGILLLIVMVSFWLKALGIIYPFFVAVDVHWHMTRAMWILEGQLPLLYGTNSPLNETTMPTAEWGEERPVIPYSPWFHIIATVFAFVPLVQMDRVANLASILLDSSRIILIALIAVRLGLSRRTALLAGATYAAMPVAFLLHAWGNLPTAFGLWLTLVCNTIIICMWERLHERRVMVTLTALLVATFLLYTVTGVFMGVFLVLLTGIVWLNGMRGGAWAELRAPLRPLWMSTGIAIALAILIYYGQYIPPIIAQTIPYMQTVFVQGPESVGVERLPFDQYLWSYVPHLDYRIWPGDYLYYGIAIPVLFTVPGFLALRKHPLAWVSFAAWGALALLFTYAGYRISMVDKQLFYLLPVICICWAIYADRIWGRWWWGRWVVLAVLAYTLYAALDQWVMRVAISEVID